MNTRPSPAAQALLAHWSGPYGGLPPLAGVDPAALEEAMRCALDLKRGEVQASASNPAPLSFTHLTLPTKRKGYMTVGAVSCNKTNGLY